MFAETAQANASSKSLLVSVIVSATIQPKMTLCRSTRPLHHEDSAAVVQIRSHFLTKK